MFFIICINYIKINLKVGLLSYPVIAIGIVFGNGFYYTLNNLIFGIIETIILLIAVKNTWKRLSEIIEKEKDSYSDSPQIKNN